LERYSHEFLVELAKNMIGEERIYEMNGYIPDVINARKGILVECKAWTKQTYEQFEKIAQMKGYKRILLIHVPEETFDELWVIQSDKKLIRCVPPFILRLKKS